MATFKELFHSRSGTSIGVGGAQGAHMLIQVRAEESDFTKVHMPFGDDWQPPFWAGLVQAEFIPRGSLFPWDTTLQSIRETFVMPVNEKTAIVRVDFASAAAEALPTSTEWLVSIRGANISARILEEYSEEESGFIESITRHRTASDSVPLPAASVGTVPARIIGPMIFEEVEGDSTSALYYYNKIDAQGNAVPIPVYDTGKRKPVGFQTEIDAFYVDMTRIIPNFKLNPTATLLVRYKNKINDREFRGAAPGHVMVADVRLNPVESDMAGQEVPGRAYRATISLLWSDELLTPWEISPTKIDDDGFEHTVFHRDTGDKVVESFRVRRTRNLEDFMALLETGAT